MIYLSAGHHNKDAGAVGNGYQENKLTMELRGLILAALGAVKTVIDSDSETLAQYIGRIKPGDGSVLCEVHFNASTNPAATGVEVIYKEGAGELSQSLAKEMSKAMADTLGIVDRGAKSETQSHRGRLGILHTNAGISVLPEICFISNKTDMEKYQANKQKLAQVMAQLLLKYDAKR